MSTKSMHLGRPEQRTRENHIPWSKRMQVILATLVLLGATYAVWQIFRAEPPVPIPDTPILPMPSP
jgi:hypothetical protein